MPDEENIEDGSVNEEKKEPMSFLHEAEQEKVRKLVSQYQKIGEAEVGVQTDLAIQYKDVAIQKNEENSKCSCHDVLLDKVTKLENKIEQLVSVIEHSVYQPGHKISTDMFNCTDQTTCSFDSFDEQSTVMETISEVASICSNTLPGMVEPTEEETAVLRPFSTRRICSRDAKQKQEFSNVIGWRKSSLLRQPITLLNSCFRFASREQIRLVKNGL